MRKKFLSFFLLFLPLLALGAEDTWKYKAYEAEFWNKLDDRFREAKLERVAVVPFNSSSDVPDPQQYQRRIESGLIQLSECRYIVLARDLEQIEALMRNFDFEMSDLFDQSTTARLGKALGAQVIVSGELFKFMFVAAKLDNKQVITTDGEVRLYLHLVQAETGRLIYEELLCFDTKSERMLPLARLHPLDAKTEMEQFRFWNSVDEVLRSDGIERLAVLPRNKKGMTDIERQFEIRLVKLADYRYSVMAHDLDRLNRILKNLNLEFSDIFDLDTVARVGKMLGTQALVLVKEADTGVGVDILNVQTGRLIFRASGSCDEVGRYRWRRF